MSAPVISSSEVERRIGMMSLAESSDERIVYAQQIKQLEAAGYEAKPNLIKLIKKTKGNVELVIKFLDARKNLHAAMEKKPWKKHDEPKFDRKFKFERKLNKEAKEQAKLEKKQEKKLAKICKKEEKEASDIDIEKKQSKLAKKLEKKAAKLEKLQFKSHLNSGEIPLDYTNVFLDGNNMLFVLAPFRSHAIRGGLAKAAEMLQWMGAAYSAVRPQLDKLMIVFDSANISVDEENFKVATARPTYKSSDDALVDWFEKMDKTEVAKSCVITSDRGLIDRLKKLGVQVYGPKAWFREARYLLSEDIDTAHDQQDLDAWASQWLNEVMKD